MSRVEEKETIIIIDDCFNRDKINKIISIVFLILLRETNRQFSSMVLGFFRQSPPNLRVSSVLAAKSDFSQYSFLLCTILRGSVKFFGIVRILNVFTMILYLFLFVIYL